METAAVVLALGGLIAALVLVDRERRRARRTAAQELAQARRETAPRAALSEALALRDALLAGVPGPAIAYGPDGRVVRANAAARALAAGLIDDPPRELTTAVGRCLASGRRETAAVTIYEPERRRFQASLEPFTSAEGPACVAVLADTRREDDYRDARRLFSAGVSHELRTPLARILALVDTLALPLDSEERAEAIDQARAEVDAMRQLIEDMILLVRLESHELTGAGERTDVTAAVEQCLERHAEAAVQHGMTLSCDATRGLVAAVAARLVDVVLDNLVSNAIRYAGEGARVDVRARGLAGAVELTVQDTGIGIPPEHLHRVFERFYRIEDARSGPGTGLGLAIVKHIAEEYGGRATVESEPGRGTTMRVVLPAPAAASTARAAARV
jgi:two-component system, OmpR family, phosphate regulon sensor histidine kinase PhoR